MTLGEKLTMLRNMDGYTQQEVAEMLELSKSTYTKYERNERKPKYETLFKLSSIFNVSIEYLINSNYKDINENSSIAFKNNLQNFLSLISNTDFLEELEYKYPGIETTLELFSEIFLDLANTRNHNIVDIIFLINEIRIYLSNIYNINKNLLLSNHKDLEYIHRESMHSAYYKRTIQTFLNDYLFDLEHYIYYEKKESIFKEYIEFRKKNKNYEYLMPH